MGAVAMTPRTTRVKNMSMVQVVNRVTSSPDGSRVGSVDDVKLIILKIIMASSAATPKWAKSRADVHWDRRHLASIARSLASREFI